MNGRCLLGGGRYALHDLRALGVKFLVVNLASEALDRVLAVAEANDLLVFNAGAPTTGFATRTAAHSSCTPCRVGRCLPTPWPVSHEKNWTQWFLVVGERPEDRLYAAALRRAAGRFGGSIVAEKTWVATHEEGARTDQEEVAVFTQGVRYDVLLVADEAGVFGDELPYRTWNRRPWRHPGSHADRLASDA